MKICFWGNIGGALKGKTDGGGELQISLLAKALAISGHEVVILDFITTEDFITDEGVRVVRINGWDNGIRIMRTLTNRLPHLYRSLKEQKADIYYCRIRDFRHILAFWAARKVKAKFVLSLASDLDAMNFSMRLKYQYLVSFKDLWSFSSGLLIEIVYPFLLKKADLILVQHEGQKRILLQKQINSVIFPNLIDINRIQVNPGVEKDYFIYVGSLKERKGFADFYNLALKAPMHSFEVVGKPLDKTGFLYYEKLKVLKNVKLLGRLNHSGTISRIAGSRALISTSPMEGFPNVFIEAWACGVPVISLHVDPGNLIEKEQLGKVAYGNMENLISEINNFAVNGDFAEKARRYVEKIHSLSPSRINEINSIFLDLLKV